MKVKFTSTRTVQDGSGTTFEKDHVYDLSDESANRWIRRGIATRFPAEGDEGFEGNPATQFESAADTKASLKEKDEADAAKEAAEKRTAKAAEKSAEVDKAREAEMAVGDPPKPGPLPHDAVAANANMAPAEGGRSKPTTVSKGRK